MYSTEANQRNSPLLRLPGEIRNKIYEYTFSGTSVYARNLRPRRKDLRPHPSLVLLTCRQIRHEATARFYNFTTFVFEQCEDVCYLVGQVGRRRASIITTIDVTGSCACDLALPMCGLVPEVWSVHYLPGLKQVRISSDYRRLVSDEEVMANIRIYFGKTDLEVIFV